MFRFLFNTVLRAAMLSLVLLALSLSSPAQAAPQFPVAGTNYKLYSQSRAQEASKLVADVRAAIGNCDGSAFGVKFQGLISFEEGIRHDSATSVGASLFSQVLSIRVNMIPM